MTTEPEHKNPNPNPPPTESHAESDTESRSGGEQLVHVIKRGVPIAILILVVVGVYLFMEEMDQSPSAEQTSAQPQGPPPEVGVVTLEAKDVPLRPNYLAQTEAYQRVEIRSRINGFLQKRAFEEGTKVQKGQLLFQIDPRSYQADLEIAQAQVETAKATLHRAKQQADRYQKLVSEDAATASELEDWQTQAEVAAAELKHARATVDKAKLDLGYTHIMAPMTGKIGEALKDVGSYVDAGSNSLLGVEEQVDPIYVRYSVSEQDLLKWESMTKSGDLRFPDRQDMAVLVTLANGEQYPQHGHVDFMDISISPTTGTAVVRADVPNPDGLLRPGQFVHATLLGIQRIDAVTVPQSAVLQTPTGASVYLLSEDQKVKQQTVKLGDWEGDQWVVTSGLKPGDRLIVDNLSILRPGMPVKPKAPAPGSTSRSRSGTGSETASAPGTAPGAKREADASEGGPSGPGS